MLTLMIDSLIICSTWYLVIIYLSNGVFSCFVQYILLSPRPISVLQSARVGGTMTYCRIDILSGSAALHTERYTLVVTREET